MSETIAAAKFTKPPPNPRRVAAGRRNRALRRGLTDSGRQRLRESARQTQPWQFAIGPKSAAARRQSVLNGKARQIGLLSVRERRALAAELAAGLAQAQQVREQAARRVHERTSRHPTEK